MEFIPLLVMLAAVYALLILPQQRRAKAHRAMLGGLDVGDEVLTASGMYGTIAEFDGETVFLAVNDGMEIKVTKSSIAEVVVYEDAE